MKKLFIAFICSFISLIPVFGESGIEKETFIYSEHDTLKLRLDKYQLKNTEKMQPCLFFVFGGGFVNGNRDEEEYDGYFDYFAKKGFTVISIDYRLGMKNQKRVGITNYKPLKNAINMAVEDLFNATRFAINHSNEWNIDTSLFIISGSSAGAITVLQAEYENRNKTNLSLSLPEHFQYAGVISFAGAIFSTDGGLKWENEKPCPMMLFHGDGDKTVPYNKIRFFKLGFFGSKHIASKLKDKGYSYHFLSFKDAGHEIATAPMKENLEDISHFINQYIFQGLPIQTDEKINQMYKVKSKKKESYKDLYNN